MMPLENLLRRAYEDSDRPTTFGAFGIVRRMREDGNWAVVLQIVPTDREFILSHRFASSDEAEHYTKNQLGPSVTRVLEKIGAEPEPTRQAMTPTGDGL
jgi:hypothetical protein